MEQNLDDMMERHYAPITGINVKLSEADSALPDREKLIKYASLKEELQMLEEEIKTLGVELKASLEAAGVKSCALPGYGTYSVVTVPRWEYSPEVTGLLERAKLMQVEEREKGIAKATPTSSFRFLPSK